MTDNRMMTMSEAYCFATETEGLAYALEILLSDSAIEHWASGRAAVASVSSILSARCKAMSETMDNGILLPKAGSGHG